MICAEHADGGRRDGRSGVWCCFDAACGTWTACRCTVGMHESIVGGKSEEPPRAPCCPVEMRDCLGQFGRRLTMMEISGAMGDLGTYIPIVVALSIQCVTSLPVPLCVCADVDVSHHPLALLCPI